MIKNIVVDLQKDDVKTEIHARQKKRALLRVFQSAQQIYIIFSGIKIAIFVRK